MEPVTHFLTGACIGRAGLNRKTRYATLVAVLAAEAADIDVLWGFGGPVESLKHHRGITHTFLAVPLVAGAAVGVVWLWDRWQQRHRARRNLALAQNVKACSAPLRFGWLYGTALLAALSHLLLDWSNNYGLRPFFPFNPRWYAGSFVFIAEPVEWALLLAAILVPWLLSLADAEVGARPKAFRGRGWAFFALAGMVLLGCWRWTEQQRARSLLDQRQLTRDAVLRVGLEPYPVNPFRWHAILETADYFQTAEIDSRTDEITSDASQRIYKPQPTAALLTARTTPLGQVYLDWGSWTVMRDLGPVAAPGIVAPQLLPGRQWTTIEFDDLRFDSSYLGKGSTPRSSPLSGYVWIIDGREEGGEAMHGREQR